jgi:hypothetical protein
VGDGQSSNEMNLELFVSLFGARSDVYAVRWEPVVGEVGLVAGDSRWLVPTPSIQTRVSNTVGRCGG